MIPSKEDILNKALIDVLDQLPNNPSLEDKLGNSEYEYTRYIQAMDEYGYQQFNEGVQACIEAIGLSASYGWISNGYYDNVVQQLEQLKKPLQ